MSVDEAHVLERLGVSRDQIAVFCARWGIIELAFFGSVLGPEFRPDSDADVLVQFSRDRLPTLGQLVEVHEELERLLGRQVDLMTRRSVEASRNPVRRAEILRTARVLYAA